MANVAHKGKGHVLVEKYWTHLESRIEMGDRGLVCRDENLCKEVEMLLTKGNVQKILNLHGLESLTVIQNSLKAFRFKTGHLGLEKISKAFEVLELAALNLYLYPWRKEYKLLKMFSGMFTHCIKPALTAQQAKELFGLLGYQPVSRHEEEELALDSKPVSADFILGLACAFFTARIECQLLLSTLGSVDASVESVLQLVKERQKGHSLHLALENTKKKIGADYASQAKLTTSIDPELDLYTDETLPHEDASRMTSSSSGSPRSNMQPMETLLSHSLHRSISQSDRFDNEKTSLEGGLCVSMLQCHISDPKTNVSIPQNPGPMESSGKEHMAGDAKKQTAEVKDVLCTCTASSHLFLYYCELCHQTHSNECIYYDICKSKGHLLVLLQDEQQPKTNVPHSVAEDQLEQGNEDYLKKHYCVSDSTSNSFLVCHSCKLIHDWNCENVKKCKGHHNVQPSGILLPPQEVDALKNHFCLSSESPEYFACNFSHDYLCENFLRNCIEQQHVVQELSETHNTPIKYHYCCVSKQLFPEVACLTCKVFHASLCSERWQCSKHNIYHLGSTCVTCSSHDIYMLCTYCCLIYCKDCWYKNPISCKCGKLFDSFVGSPV